MSKILIDESNGQKLIHCPGCDQTHVLDDRWKFNGDLESPTFSPSLKVQSGRNKDNTGWNNNCHSFIKKGVWEYLGDCTHSMAGQKVPVPNWDGIK